VILCKVKYLEVVYQDAVEWCWVVDFTKIFCSPDVCLTRSRQVCKTAQACVWRHVSIWSIYLFIYLFVYSLNLQIVWAGWNQRLLFVTTWTVNGHDIIISSLLRLSRGVWILNLEWWTSLPSRTLPPIFMSLVSRNFSSTLYCGRCATVSQMRWNCQAANNGPRVKGKPMPMQQIRKSVFEHTKAALINTKTWQTASQGKTKVESDGTCESGLLANKCVMY
jgi:hypothetical protein